MFFPLSKIAWFFAAPSNILILSLCFCCFARSFLGWRSAGALSVVIGALLIGSGFSPLGRILTSALEDRFPPWQPEGRVPDGIIVLGGWTDTAISVYRGKPAVGASSDRIIELVSLARRYPKARLVFSGGDGSFSGDIGNEADDAARVAANLGLAEERISYERSSRNTYENLLFTRDMVKPKPGELWLLVTSGWHMPRAIGIARAIGFKVEPYPVDFRTRGFLDATRGFTTLSEGLARVDEAVHEWVGLAAYYASGKSSALFPSP